MPHNWGSYARLPRLEPMAGGHRDIHGRHTLVPAPAEEEALVFHGADLFEPRWDFDIEVGLHYRSGSKWPYSKYEDLEEDGSSVAQVEGLADYRQQTPQRKCRCKPTLVSWIFR